MSSILPIQCTLSRLNVSTFNNRHQLSLSRSFISPFLLFVHYDFFVPPPNFYVIHLDIRPSINSLFISYRSFLIYMIHVAFLLTVYYTCPEKVMLPDPHF